MQIRGSKKLKSQGQELIESFEKPENEDVITVIITYCILKRRNVGDAVYRVLPSVIFKLSDHLARHKVTKEYITYRFANTRLLLSRSPFAIIFSVLSLPNARHTSRSKLCIMCLFVYCTFL